MFLFVFAVRGSSVSSIFQTFVYLTLFCLGEYIKETATTSFFLDSQQNVGLTPWLIKVYSYIYFSLNFHTRPSERRTSQGKYVCLTRT